METTVASFFFRQARTRSRWPSWRAPIVGTKPMLFLAVRHLRDCCWKTWGSARTFMGSGAGVEFAAADFLGVTLDGFLDLVVKMEVSLGVLGMEVRQKAHHVVEHLHLPVAMRPGANADRGDFQGPADFPGDFSGDQFQD